MFDKLKEYARKFLGLGGEGLRGWITLAGDNLHERERSGFADAAVRAIVNAACNGELQLRTSDGSVIPYEKKGKNPLYDLFYQPTVYFNENIFKQIITYQFLYFGNVFIFKDARDSKGRPTRLIPIPPPCIEPLLDNYGYPYAYSINTINGSFTVPREDIIHIYEGNATNLFLGQSRMLRCKIDSDIMNAAKTFNLAFFRNGASVGGVITYPDGQNVSPTEAQELLRFFNDQNRGAEKAHRTALLTKGGKYESFKTSHKDMEYGEGLKFHQQQILSIAGVPPAMVGLFEFAPQFNTKEQQKIFYETNIIPMMRLFADAFSEELVPEFFKEEDVYVWYDFSNVKALGTDWEEMGRAVQLLAQYYPINEVTKVLGLPFSEIPGGNEPPNPVLTAFGLQAKPNDTKALELEHKRIRYIRPTPAQMKRHKAQKLALIAEQSEIMRKSIDSHFKMQADLVRDWIYANEDKLFDYKEVFGSEKEQQQLLLAVKVPAIADIFGNTMTFERNYLQSLAPQKDFKFYDAKAMQDRVQQWAQEYAFKWADSIEQTTFKRLDRIITMGIENGMSNREINNIVLQFFSEEGYEPTMITENATAPAGRDVAHISIFNRVDTIVQTETLATISEAQLESYRSTEFVTGKGWITTMGISDHHEGHLELDGQEVRMTEDFTNPVTGQKTPAPGQFGTADQDINCLCDMYPIVLDGE